MTERSITGFRWILSLVAMVTLALGVYFWRQGQMSNAPGGNVARSNIQTAPPSPSKTSGSIASSPSTHSVAADGSVAIPLRFQLPGIARAKSGASFREWIAQYPADQQRKIGAFDKQHFGVYKVNSPLQVAWMAENGYPMPEDVVAAEALTDVDLRELTKQGNDKAGFLLRERNIVSTKAKLEAYRAQGKTDADFWTNDPDAQQLRADDLMTTQLLQQSHSPFKGYVQAQDALLQSEQLGVDTHVIAGLEWAQSLGDFRASQFLLTYIENDPVRQAMATAAFAVSANASIDSMLMRASGCQNAGVPAGMYIPGTGSPVE